MGNGARTKQIRDVHSDAISAMKKMEELDATFKNTIISHLRIQYREFTYCDDDWKVYSFISNFYSNWHRNLKDKEKRASRKRAQALEASQSVEEMSAREYKDAKLRQRHGVDKSGRVGGRFISSPRPSDVRSSIPSISSQADVSIPINPLYACLLLHRITCTGCT